MQGLADAFILMRYPFASEEAQLLNRQIFETIYHAALTASCELAKRDGAYETYEGSPCSQGVGERVCTWWRLGQAGVMVKVESISYLLPSAHQVLQYDMWGVTPTDLWDWAALKAEIAK